MPGPLPKPPECRQRRNATAKVVPLSPAPVEPPAPPKGLLKATRESWQRFWRSDLAALVNVDTDMPALERLFRFYDAQARQERAHRKQPIVPGSKGQPVANPAGDFVLKIEPHIRALEDRFGLTPHARLRLNISLADATASLEELNRRYTEAEEDEDPRLSVLDVEAWEEHR